MSFPIALCVLLLSAALNIWDTRRLIEASEQRVQVRRLTLALSDLHRTMLEAETGQRGFLLTGEERYRQPYDEAVRELPSRLAAVRALQSAEPGTETKLDALQPHVEAKMSELREALEAFQTSGPEAGLAVIRSGRGAEAMTAIHELISSIERDTLASLDKKAPEVGDSARRNLWGLMAGGAVSFIVLTLIYIRLRRETAARREAGLALRDANEGLEQRVVERTAELQKSKQRYRHLFGAITDAIIVWEIDADGTPLRFADLNDAACALLGGTREEILRLPITRFIQTGGIAGSRATIAALRRAGSLVFERTVPTLRGDQVPVEMSARLFEMDGNSYAMAVGRDVSERKRVEQELRDSRARTAGIIDSAMDAILTVDENMRITLFNAAAEAMFGCRAEDVLGESLDRFIPPRFRDAHAGHVRHFGETGISGRRMGKLGSLSGLRTDGTEFPIEASISQIEVGGRKLFTVILRDVTDRQRAENELRRFNAELEQRVVERTAELRAKNKELETFTYSVSHDLKAPLRGIDGYSRLLLEDYSEKLDDEGRLFLANIRHGADMMQQLIDDLLEYSRIERRAMTTTRIEIRPLLERILAERSGDLASAEVTVDVAPEQAVHADAAGVGMALGNLVDNAAKFSRHAQPRRLEIRSHAEDGRCVISVRDNGTGFDMKYHDLIFQIFQRLHRTEEFDGTGVGLAIVRKAMERMGGRVWAESRPGEGSVFFLDLPTAVN